MKGVAMDKATLTINNETFDLPVITGSMNEKAIDISELRKKSVYHVRSRLSEYRELSQRYNLY